MALTHNPSRRWLARFHLLIRFAGLTGLLALVIGLFLIVLEQVVTWEELRTFEPATAERLLSLFLGESGDPMSQWAVRLTACGAAAAALALLVELFRGILLTAGKRSAFGVNAAAQVALAVAITAGINAYSFDHYCRWDWTRDKQFTLSAHLPESILEQLRQLQTDTPTIIVVYQRHKTFGHLSEKPDVYDYAAERKVVEKVHDLVDQFRELGKQFEVIALDVEEEKYNEKLGRLKPDLRQAIDNAPENSIFFYSPAGPEGSRVQRLSFNDFFQLDKTASQKQGNLVLLKQGPQSFARKVLNIEEKRPRVAIAVTYQVLSTDGPDLYGLRGLKRALTAEGFDVRDIILKRPIQTGMGTEPAAYTLDESRFSSLEDRLNGLDAILKLIDAQIRKTLERKDLIAKGTDEGMARARAMEILLSPLAPNLSEREITQRLLEDLKGVPAQQRAEIRRDMLTNIEQTLDSLNKARDQIEKQREKRSKEKDELDTETFAEQRRITDLKVKFDRLLEDCDLLIIPRMTIVSLAPSLYIPNEVHKLEPTQVKAIQDFLKAGKPVLACFGPVNEPTQQRRRPPSSGEPDRVEDLFAKLGLTFGKQTVLFDEEAEALAVAPADELDVPAAPEGVPPVDFKWEIADKTKSQPNPIRTSMLIATRSVGKSLDLEIHYLRPVAFEPARGRSKGGHTATGVNPGEAKGKGPSEPAAEAKAKTSETELANRKGEGEEIVEPREVLPYGVLMFAMPPAPQSIFGSFGSLLLAPRSSKGLAKGGITRPGIEPDFMRTTAGSWKEDQPFPSRGRALLPSAEKRGPVPVGVAVETPVPAEWIDSSTTTTAPQTVRVAAIGHGGWFVGGDKDVTPAKEKLILDVCNWLLRRDDLLIKDSTPDNPPWSFPRIALETKQSEIWHWGTQIGIPVLFIYLGLVVLMVRRLR
jgi:hypothetical protein